MAVEAKANGYSDGLRLWTTADDLQDGVDKGSVLPCSYIRGGFLGSGGWSKVYKVKRLSDGCVFAGKISEARNKLHKEASILKSLNHVSDSDYTRSYRENTADRTSNQDRLLGFMELVEDETCSARMLLVMELCAGGNLQSQIDQFPEELGRHEALQVVFQVAQALDYLHSKNFLHTDVKPRNILIRTWKPVDVVLADCADIKVVGRQKSATGTEAYFSPQMVRLKRNTGLSDDIWALGITFMGLVKQWPPVARTKDGLQKYPRRCFDHAQNLKSLNPDHDLINLLTRMLEWESEPRASASECMRLAKECLDNEWQGFGDGLGDFMTPDEFKPISFW